MNIEEYLKNIEDNNVSYWLYVRENLKPNGYVKLNTGEITRSINVSPIRENKIYYANGDDCWFDIAAVRNFSPNILDLIQVGDYVNGKKVIDTYNDYLFDYSEAFRVIRFSETDILHNASHIKSIVTKEQFESMEYRIGE